MNTLCLTRLATVCLSVLMGLPAWADGPRLPTVVAPAAYQQECAGCHMAYPPGLLPAASWQRMMTGLDKHFGTDASLDAATVQKLSGWLQANAATGSRLSTPPPQDRISQASWFVREHREIDPLVWKHTSVKSAANCLACHSGAEKGQFNEHGITIPAGLDARLRRSLMDD